jgi:EAL domain-containing protein (putative c-di-GMP-specific phosphodiesterase class I)
MNQKASHFTKPVVCRSEPVAISGSDERKEGLAVRGHDFDKNAVSYVVLTIANLGEIETVYGRAIVSAVQQAIVERARALSAKLSYAVCVIDKRLFFNLRNEFFLGTDAAEASRRVLHEAHAIAVALGDAAVATQEGAIFVAIAVSVVPSTDTEPSFSIQRGRYIKNKRSDWESRYAEDMKIAEQLLHSLERGDLCFRFERVCDVMRGADADADAVHYYEALLCMRGPVQPFSVGKWIPSLERLGIVKRLDRWVVTAVLEELRRHPTISLGCNISVHSAFLDGFWLSLLDTLVQEPHVAERLVIEITESAPIADMDSVREFVRSLHLAGCQVAIDDVGAGYSSVRSVVELGTDIVKIAGDYVWDARGDENAQTRLKLLIDLIRACGATTVVEGIERESDLLLAVECGAKLVQGYLFEPNFDLGLLASV